MWTVGWVKCDICTYQWVALVGEDGPLISELEGVRCPCCGNMAGYEPEREGFEDDNDEPWKV